VAEALARLRTRTVSADLHRIVPSRFPPVGIFDTARDAEELEMLAELEGLTNERLRQALGQIQLVAREDVLVGAGTTPIMAAFCHPSPSRFTDGSFGIYYAGLDERTAILETVHHRARMLRDAGIPQEALEMRRYVSRLRQPMTLLPPAQRTMLLDPDDYSAPQRFGATLHARRAWGIYYPSVRDAGGHCVAVLRPPALAPARQASHYRYYWDGERIDRVERIETFAVGEMARTAPNKKS